MIEDHDGLLGDDDVRRMLHSIRSATVTATADDLVVAAREAGFPYAVVLEVPPLARAWLLVPGEPTPRLRDWVDDVRPAGVTVAVKSLSELNGVVAELMADSFSEGVTYARSQTLLGRAWNRWKRWRDERQHRRA